MRGICVQVGISPDTKIERTSIKEMTNSISHRGLMMRGIIFQDKLVLALGDYPSST